jgi:hypothetical protein
VNNIIAAHLAPWLLLMAGAFIIVLFILLAVAAGTGTYDD